MYEVTKCVIFQITKHEVYMLHDAFERFTPNYQSYKDRDYQKYIKKYGKKRAGNKLVEDKEKPTIEDFNHLKEFFTNLYNLHYCGTYAPYDHITHRLRFYNRQPEIVIKVLLNLLKDQDYFSKNYYKPYDRLNRDDDEFTIKIYKEDCEGLIVGMQEIKQTLDSHWVEGIELRP